MINSTRLLSFPLIAWMLMVWTIIYKMVITRRAGRVYAMNPFLRLFPVALLLSCSIASASYTSTNPHPGQKIYQKHCVAFHQVDGKGIPPVFPALENSTKVNQESPKEVIDILLNGVSGSSMMSFSDRLSSQDIADVLTYIRSSWENTGSGVTIQQIENAKKK